MSHPLSIANADFLKWPETMRLLLALNDARIEARFVGGCVRDTLLNLTATDVDLCTPTLPEPLYNALESHGVRAIPTGIEHGTITAVINQKHFEITTLRRDVACDGRHADVVFTDSYSEDASRRDFTVNALSADMHGRVYDYHDGIADLQAKYLRFIGSASDRITEDALRILRLFRFQAQLEFAVDDDALDACTDLKEKLGIISAERIKSEIFKLLDTVLPVNALQNMQTTGVWQQLFGAELSSDVTPLLAAEVALSKRAGALIRFAWLMVKASPSDVSALCRALQEKFRLSNDETQKLKLWLTNLAEIRPILLLAEQRKLQRRLGTSNYQTLILLACADDKNIHIPAYQEMLAEAASWEIPVFALSGTDLMQLGFKQGAALGKTLQELEKHWEYSGYVLSKTELLEQAKTMLK